MARSSLGPTLQQTLGQQQLLLPRMLQSIEVLQLPAQELESWLRAQVEGNEALELVEAEAAAPVPRGVRSGGGGREASEAHDEMLRNLPDRDAGLARQVSQEVALVQDDEAVLAWLRFLVECLDERGFLTLDDETLLRLGCERDLDPDPALLERAIERLQSLEPRGLGARGPVQALLLQLDPDDPDHALLRALLVDFLDELARNKLPAVARALGVSLADLQRLIARLGQLEPAPAAALHEQPAPPLRPDLVVESTQEGFELRLERSQLPSVRLERDVERLARDRRQAPEVRRYLRGKLDRARWLIEALEQREHTLLRVAGALFAHQRAFLEHGPGHLIPLRMSALAAQLELHVSTVSRAVAGKHAQTPWGIVPLRRLFQGSAGADEGCAREDVLRAVRELFEAEDPSAPLSDDEAAAVLARRGWRLARRTLAKYRRELGIASSYRRRRYT